jgi:predicted DNA-binding WGR domain protein
VLPVYAKDWLQQPQKVMEQVLRALGDNTATIPLGTSGPQDHPAFRRLVLGEKWWEAATDSRQPIVRYGRSGSKGQITLRTFPDEGSARDELERQLEEQRQKGFVAETREPPQTWEPQTWEPPKA